MSASQANITERLTLIIMEQMGVERTSVTPDAQFVFDLGCDSLDTIELIMAVEEEFGVDIPDGEADDLDTVRKAIDYLESKGVK
jgi:acyl carrier protein